MLDDTCTSVKWPVGVCISMQVPEICLGTMTWGQQNTEKDAHEQLSYALDCGVNFMDTAEMYPIPTTAETQVEITIVVAHQREDEMEDENRLCLSVCVCSI